MELFTARVAVELTIEYLVKLILFFNPKTSPGAILIYRLLSAHLRLQLSCNVEFYSCFH